MRSITSYLITVMCFLPQLAFVTLSQDNFVNPDSLYKSIIKLKSSKDESKAEKIYDALKAKSFNWPDSILEYGVQYIGLAQRDFNKLNENLDFFFKVKEDFKVYNVSSIEANFWINKHIGDNYRFLELFDKADSIYNVIINDQDLNQSKYLHKVYQNLGDMFVASDKDEQGLDYLIKSEALILQQTKVDSFKIMAVNNSKAVAYQKMGLHTKALKIFEEGANYCERNAPNSKHIFIMNLGTAYDYLGYSIEAMKQYYRALELYKEKYGESHPRYFGLLSNLADVKYGLGDYKGSKFLYEKAYNGFRSLNIYNVWTVLFDTYTAGCLIELNQLDQAKFRLDNIISEFESKKVLDTFSSAFGTILEHYAKLASANNNFKEEVSYLKRSATIYDSLKYSSKVVSIKMKLIRSYLDQKEMDQSHLLFSEVNEKLKEDDFDGSSLKSEMNFFEARIKTIEGDTIKAKEKLEELLDASKEELSKYLVSFSQNELEVFISQYQENLSEYLNLWKDHSNNQGWNQFVLNEILYVNQILLKNAIQFKIKLSLNNEIENLELFEEYDHLSNKILQFTSGNISGVDSLEVLKDRIEFELKQSLNYTPEDLQTDWSSVKNLLASNELIIQYFQFQNAENKTFCGAIIFSNKGIEKVQFIDYLKLKKAFSENVNKQKISTLYGVNSKGLLYDLLVKEIQPLLIKYKSVYIVQEGIFSKINHAAIVVDEQGGLLNEMIGIKFVNFLNEDPSKISKNIISRALLIGNVNYGEDTLLTKDNTRGIFNALSHSKTEIDKVKETLGSTGVDVFSITSDLATEQNFYKKIDSLQSVSILHFTTHAYYNEENNTELNVPSYLKNDLFNSGILLKDAPKSWTQDFTLLPAKDDILTSAEMSRLDLSQTKLAVLAACETGLGSEDQFEGLRGLRRALSLAGVQAQILSLWKIPDFQTSLLINSFYKMWMQEKFSPSKALKMAQEEIRLKYPEPYYWAGFILIDSSPSSNLSPTLSYALYTIIIIGCLCLLYLILKKRKE